MICAAYLCSAALSYGMGPVIKVFFAAALLMTAAAVFLIYRKRNTGSAIIAAVALAAAFSAFVSFIYFDVKVAGIREYIGSEHDATAVVTGVEYANAYSGSYTVEVRNVDGSRRNFKALLTLEFGGDLSDGDLVRFRAAAESPENANRYFDYKSYNSSRGIDIVFTVSDIGSLDLIGFGEGGAPGFFRSLNAGIGRVFYRYFDDEVRGLLSALFLGDRSDLGASVRRDFTRAGIPHMLAISGMHLSVLAAMLLWLLSALRCPALPRRIILVAAVVFYMLLTGMRISVVRASLMFIMTVAGEAIMSRSDPPTSLFLSAAVIITFSPCSIIDTGFLLSFTTTLGIVTFGKAASDRIKNSGKGGAASRVIKGLLVSLSSTAAAMMFSLPVVWIFFGEMSVVSPIANLIFSLPMAAVIILTALTAVLSFIPPAASAVALPLGTLSKAVLSGVRFFSRLRGVMISLRYPFAVFIAVAAAVIIAALIIAEKDRLTSISAVLAASVAVFALSAAIFEYGLSKTVRVVYQPVKKNDVICAMASGSTLVVDISDGSRTTHPIFEGIVSEYFCRGDIDVYMITHWHTRTPSSVSALLERCRVDKLLLPEPRDEASSESAERVKLAADAAGVQIVFYPSDITSSVDIGALRIDAAKPGRIGRSGHPTSALRFSFGSGSVIYAGASAYDSAQYEELDEWQEAGSVLILGAHGPKAEYPPLLPEDLGIGTAVVWDGFSWADELGVILGADVIKASDERPVTFSMSAD